jgi:hypothetical protein
MTELVHARGYPFRQSQRFEVEPGNSFDIGGLGKVNCQLIYPIRFFVKLNRT